jgi:hypothetical protein
VSCAITSRLVSSSLTRVRSQRLWHHSRNPSEEGWVQELYCETICYCQGGIRACPDKLRQIYERDNDVGGTWLTNTYPVRGMSPLNRKTSADLPHPLRRDVDASECLRLGITSIAHTPLVDSVPAAWYVSIDHFVLTSHAIQITDTSCLPLLNSPSQLI